MSVYNSDLRAYSDDAFAKGRTHFGDSGLPPTASVTNNATSVPALARSLALGVDRRTLGAEELAGDVEGLAAHNDNLLAVEQLFGDGAGEATEQVALAVDDLNHKSARGSSAMLRCRGIGRRQCGPRLPICEGTGSCFRKLRTMTGSKVDMVSIPGVVLEG